MALLKISVTQLKCAVLDEDFRRRLAAGKKASTFLGTSAAGYPVYGARFHKIAEEFVKWLTKAGPRTKRPTAEDDLWAAMYDHFAETYLVGLTDKNQVDSAYHLASCLKAFCRRLSELRKRTPNFKDWADLFLTREFSVKNVAIDLNGAAIAVSGQIDAVRLHPESGVEIVDYKLTKGESLKHDLVQVAVYAAIFARKKPGMARIGVLEYYEPDVKVVTVDSASLDEIFRDIVMPVLFELAETAPTKPAAGATPAQAALPLSGFPTTGGPPPASAGNRAKPSEPVEQTGEETQKGSGIDRPGTDHSEAIRRAFSAFKLRVTVLERVEAPQIIRYKVQPAPGVKVVSLANRAEDLKVHLNLEQEPFIGPAKGAVTIDVPKDTPDTVMWRKVVKRPEYLSVKSKVAFPVGVGIDGKAIIADFTDPNMCHALVAGASGSGKSEFLKSLIASLITRNTPQSLKLTIIDPKLLTFGPLKGCPYLTGPIVTNSTEAISCLETAIDEMENRYVRLDTEGFEKLGDRIGAGKTDIPFHIVVFDEFADLILGDTKQKKTFETLVSRLAAQGRASGVHLVLATQRPDTKIVTGLIKANLPLKICLRVTNSTNSSIVLDEVGGETLLGKGDLFCNRGKGKERAQSPYIPPEELQALAGTQ